jgi:hypothetical protein
VFGGGGENKIERKEERDSGEIIRTILCGQKEGELEKKSLPQNYSLLGLIDISTLLTPLLRTVTL